MEVICEKYKECLERHNSDFDCHHSSPHENLGDTCKENGNCGECNSLPLRKKKLKKLYDCNL